MSRSKCLMEDFLQTFPQITAVYNGADSTALGAAQAIASSGKAGSIVITATDFQPDMEKFIREGVITGSVLRTDRLEAARAIVRQRTRAGRPR